MDKTADKLAQHHSKEWRGLPVIVEWPRGSIRIGEKEDGTPFKGEMKADYGYIPQTEATGDEERLDVYIGPDEDADYVYAIEQLDDAGEFDEWKLMLGFASLEDAEEMYLAHNDEGWEETHVGKIEEIPFEDLLDQVGRQQEKIEEKTAAPKSTSISEQDERTLAANGWQKVKGTRPVTYRNPDIEGVRLEFFGAHWAGVRDSDGKVLTSGPLNQAMNVKNAEKPNVEKTVDGIIRDRFGESALEFDQPQSKNKSELEKLALEQFPRARAETERIYILQNGTVLSCDDMDHFTVENFYKDEEGESRFEDEDAINQFLEDTGAVRAGFYENTYMAHGGSHPPTEAQLRALSKHFQHWEEAVTKPMIVNNNTKNQNLPAHTKPGQLVRAFRELYGKTAAKAAGKHTLVEAFVKNYEHEIDFYQEVASLVQDKLDSALQDAGIKAIVSSRAKRPSRLEKKIEKRAPEKGYRTFSDISDDIVDLAGCRVALYMPADREHVGQIIEKLFTEVRPAKHFPEDRSAGDSIGYIADHYLVKLRPETLRKKEYRYADTQVEIQVASILMHAFSEISHDLIYKPQKGKLTSNEIAILNGLNETVRLGEKQLEQLQNTIENRTKEDLRFEIMGCLQPIENAASATPDAIRVAVSKLASLSSKPTLWRIYLETKKRFDKPLKR